MKDIKDIRPLKNKLRENSKSYRRSLALEEKEKLDSQIANKLFNMWQYREAETMLLYVSTDIEVDTKKIIERALNDKKTVAVPRCIDGTREMGFYVISSLSDLEPGSFGVLEPICEKCRRLDDLTQGLCIVPALCFDERGYRLGYGKGYYDRFLSKFCGETVGICYNACVADSLPHGKYDKKVDKIITQSRIILTKTEKGGKNR